MTKQGVNIHCPSCREIVDSKYIINHTQCDYFKVCHRCHSNIRIVINNLRIIAYAEEQLSAECVWHKVLEYNLSA